MMKKFPALSWLFFMAAFGGALSAQLWAGPQFGGQIQAGGRVSEDLAYTMPAGWIDQPAQGPNVKAHYVLYQGAIPYCEMSLYCDPLAQPMSLDQAFQQGVERVRPALQGYREYGTRRAKIAGQDAIVHDFSYYAAGSVTFMARGYILIVNNKLYNFLFNTVSNYFNYVQSSFDPIIATVSLAPAAAVPAGGAPGTGTGGGTGAGTTVDEQAFSFDLPAGWAPSNDSAGAKYRWYGAGGQQLGAFFIFEPDTGAAISSLFGDVNPGQLLDSALANEKKNTFDKMENYKPANTVKTKLGGFDALVHDFTFSQGPASGYYRWYFVVYKPKADAGATRYATNVYVFAFMSTALNQLETVKPQFDAIMGSIRVKGAPAAQPAAGANPAAGAGNPAGAGLPALNPQGKPPAAGLPALTEGPAAAPAYKDPDGRFAIPLPAGTAIFGQDGNLTSYKNAEKKAYLQIWSFKTVNEAMGMRDYAMKAKTLNGKQVTLDIAGREVLVGLYTGGDQTSQKTATVAAVYPAVGLFMSIEVPIGDYAADQAWISDILNSVQFLK